MCLQIFLNILWRFKFCKSPKTVNSFQLFFSLLNIVLYNIVPTLFAAYNLLDMRIIKHIVLHIYGIVYLRIFLKLMYNMLVSLIHSIHAVIRLINMLSAAD